MEALIFVKSAGAAINRYQLYHGALPQYFADLDITLPGTYIPGAPAAGSGAYYDQIDISKYYYALLHKPSGGVTAYRKNEAVQEPKISTYNGKASVIYCVASASNTKAEKICRSLGAKEANPPVIYCGWGVGDFCLVIARL